MATLTSLAPVTAEGGVFDSGSVAVLNANITAQNTNNTNLNGAPVQVNPNYQGTEAGANNAVTCNLLDPNGVAIPLAAGLLLYLKVAHTLQAGANTLAINGGSAKAIKSHLSTANNIATAYAVGSIVPLMYDGTQWQDLSQ
jgi:hypothetical protein